MEKKREDQLRSGNEGFRLVLEQPHQCKNKEDGKPNQDRKLAAVAVAYGGLQLLGVRQIEYGP